MARSFNIVLSCAVVAIVLPFATGWTHWQNGHLPKQIAKQENLQDRTRIEKVDLVNSILDITYKFKTNISEKINETKTYFKEMESQLNGNNIVQIDIVQQGIQKRNSTTSYSDTSNEIMYSLTALLEFLDDPMDEDLEEDFYNQATTIPTHLENLFNGLLGRNDFNADIMDTLRNLNKCHGRKLQEQVQSITSFITTGFAVHLAYQQLQNGSQVTNYSLANFVVESSMNVTERLNEMVLECRTNENNVTKEMSDIIKAHQFAQNPPSTSSEFNEIIADALQSYLEDKYDTKMWVVVVKTREFGYLYKQLSCILSSGFHHQVKVQDTVAAAISINKTDAPQLSSASLFLKDFQFPFIKKNPVYNDTISSEIHQQLIEKYLNVSLELMRTQVETEIIMARNLTKNETDLVIRISNDLPFMAFDTFDSQIYDDNLLVIFIPVRNSSYLPFSSLNKEHSTNCRWNSSPEHGPLRNDITDLYLSVERDSIKEGAYIILYCWTNSSSQRWQFVNDQLRNDNGKCLTAMTAESQFLYQHNCNHNWTGQKWYRNNGLQIVNGFGLCLVYSENHEGYITQDVCGLGDRQIHSQYWQDFHSDCTDKLKTRTANNFNGYILFRMAGTKDYITASENNVYLNPWINEPGQYWQFIDGKMMNGNGKCLIFRDDSWKVEMVDCNNITTGHQLAYNDSTQIMNEKGYCLTFDYEYDYDNCRDEIRQLWIPESEPIDCVF